MILEEIQMLWTAAEKRASDLEAEVATLRTKAAAQQKMLMDLQRAEGKAKAKAKRPPPIDEGD